MKVRYFFLLCFKDELRYKSKNFAFFSLKPVVVMSSGSWQVFKFKLETFNFTSLYTKEATKHAPVHTAHHSSGSALKADSYRTMHTNTRPQLSSDIICVSFVVGGYEARDKLGSQ